MYIQSELLNIVRCKDERINNKKTRKHKNNEEKKLYHISLPYINPDHKQNKI